MQACRLLPCADQRLFNPNHRTDLGALSRRLLSFSTGAISMNIPAKLMTNQQTIIVFGVSAIGKPRAGTFKGSDVSAARKAAAKLGLSVVDLTDEAGLALAAKVPAGRIGGAGDNIIPFINKDLHGQIKTFETKGQKNGRAQTDGGLGRRSGSGKVSASAAILDLTCSVWCNAPSSSTKWSNSTPARSHRKCRPATNRSMPSISSNSLKMAG